MDTTQSRSRRRGNTATNSAFRRINEEYGRPSDTMTGPGHGGPGYGVSSSGYGQVPQYRVPDRLFSANKTYDKLIVLVTIALVAAAVGYVGASEGLGFGCLLIAFVIVLASWFRMHWAKVLAPAYAVFEGVGLGALSRAYSNVAHGVVPLAIVFTSAVFVACLVLYRTGLVRVTPRMASLALMGGFGIIAISVLSLLGLSLPGVNSFGPAGVVFGILILGIAILNLFTDFEYVNQAERMGVSSDAEWSAALAIMVALVLVYISILRILASSRR